MSKTENVEVKAEVEAPSVKLTPEQKQIVQLAESCATVFELVSRSIPSNHAPTVQLEVKRMKDIIQSYQPPKKKKSEEAEA